MRRSITGLALTDLFVFLDLIVFPRFDFYPYRLVSTTVGTFILLRELIQKSE